MTNGIVGNCGCSGYVGGQTETSPVYVETFTGILTDPTQATFYSQNNPFGYQEYSFGSVATQVIKQGAGKLLTTVPVSLLVGTGAYTLSLQLDYVNAILGAIFEVQLSFSASTNPTVIFFDRQSGNQLAYTIVGAGVIFTTVFRFVWTGTTWKFVYEV
jgi:hypothetical protein